MDGIEEILIGGGFRIGLTIQENRRVVWINGHDGAQTVMGSNLSQHDGGPSLEAPNLHNRATSLSLAKFVSVSLSIANPFKAVAVMPRILGVVCPHWLRIPSEIHRRSNASLYTPIEIQAALPPDQRNSSWQDCRLFANGAFLSFSVASTALENLTHPTPAQ